MTSAKNAVPMRREDEELIGFLVPHEHQWVPYTIFGYALGAPMPHEQAESLLHAEGLSCLADRWELQERGQWITVQIIEADPAQVSIRYADYGHPELFGSHRTLTAPVTGMLRRR